MAESAWAVQFADWAPVDEGRVEALCTLGNGVFATRGADAEFGADGVHYPGTYASGVFNRLVSAVAGRTLEHESMVNLPNWLPLTFRIGDGGWLDASGWEITDHTKTVDLRTGLLTRVFEVRDGHGRRCSVTERRMVSMADPHLAAIEWTITPENWSGSLIVRSSLDGSVENRNVVAHQPLAGRHLRVVDTGSAAPDVISLEAENSQSHLRCAVAAWACTATWSCTATSRS